MVFPNSLTIPSLPPTYWVLDEAWAVSTTLERFSFPHERVQMNFTKKLEYEHACTNWCLLDWACIPWQLGPTGKKKQGSHAEPIDNQGLRLHETTAYLGSFLVSFETKAKCWACRVKGHSKSHLWADQTHNITM